MERYEQAAGDQHDTERRIEEARRSGRVIERTHRHPARPAGPYVLKRCRYCDEEFATNFHAARRVYCSEACRRGSTKDRQDERLRDVWVEDVSLAFVFRRDGGRCRMCGCEVRMLAEGAAWSPDMATRDHVVPVSAGGRHEKGNVVLACIACNIAKGNKPL